MIKKTARIALSLLVLLVGCSQKRVHLAGEGNYWIGEYEANLDKNSVEGEYKFSYKGNESNNIKSIEIRINDNETIRKEESLPGNKIITIPYKCSDCSSIPKESIKVNISWSNKGEDIFSLTGN